MQTFALLAVVGLAPPARVPLRHAPVAPSGRRTAAISMDGEMAPEFRGTQDTAPNMLQAEAIRSESDAVLLLAPPGTGKTRVLRARIAYLRTKGVPPSAILVVTFTQHAAQQRSTQHAAQHAAQGIRHKAQGTRHKRQGTRLKA